MDKLKRLVEYKRDQIESRVEQISRTNKRIAEELQREAPDYTWIARAAAECAANQAAIVEAEEEVKALTKVLG